MERGLTAGIDELLHVDIDTLSDAELHHVFIAMMRAESKFAAARARFAAAWDARRIWADDGSKAAWARLAREAGLSPMIARIELRRGRRLRDMTCTRTALEHGDLSIDEADLLVRINQPALSRLFQRDEAVLVAQLRDLRYTDGQRVTQYWESLAHDEADTDRPDLRRDRHLDAVRTFRRAVDIQGRLDAIAGTVFLDELNRREQELFEQDWAALRERDGADATPELLPRTATQRRADALVEMAKRSAAIDRDAVAPRPLFTVLCGLDEFKRTCELAADQTVVSPRELAPYVRDADVERIVFDAPSRVIDVGVRHRYFTGALRRAIQVRDRHCRHRAGCDVPAEKCQIDHIVPYSQGGLTVQENGRCYCERHNLMRNHDRGPPDAT